MGNSREAVRWSASEGSLLLTVAGSLNAGRIWRGGGGLEEHDRAGKGGGGGPMTFYREDIRRGSGGSYFEGGEGRHRSWLQAGGRMKTGE